MDNRGLELGFVPAIQAESFGQPGQRTFRLFADTGMGSLSLWLEKGQIVMLGTAITDLLERVPGAGLEPSLLETPRFIGELDVKVGSLAVGYDEERDGFLLEASEFITQLDLTSVRFLTTREQFRSLQRQIGEIVAGSRPRCVLCGTPLNGEAHFCPPSNGHARGANEE